jgi:hypothetical protein
MLGGISQPRISQLVKAGHLVVEQDISGRYRYDRIATEKLAAQRVVRHAYDRPDAEAKKALQAEARDRLRRQREREEQEERERERRHDDWRERSVIALELIAQRLKGIER